MTVMEVAGSVYDLTDEADAAFRAFASLTLGLESAIDFARRYGLLTALNGERVSDFLDAMRDVRFLLEFQAALEAKNRQWLEDALELRYGHREVADAGPRITALLSRALDGLRYELDPASLRLRASAPTLLCAIFYQAYRDFLTATGNLRRCRGCETVFVARSPRQEYCSPKCSARHRKRQERKRPKEEKGRRRKKGGPS